VPVVAAGSSGSSSSGGSGSSSSDGGSSSSVVVVTVAHLASSPSGDLPLSPVYLILIMSALLYVCLTHVFMCVVVWWSRSASSLRTGNSPSSLVMVEMTHCTYHCTTVIP
jgi:hypothetical protein